MPMGINPKEAKNIATRREKQIFLKKPKFRKPQRYSKEAGRVSSKERKLANRERIYIGECAHSDMKYQMVTQNITYKIRITQ